MVDKRYQYALKQINDILENTEEELVNQIPKQVKEFIQKNMDKNYESKIQKDKDLDKQGLLPETEDILSLFYRNYWATEEEKIEFYKKDEIEWQEEMKKQKEQSIEKILEKRKNRTQPDNTKKELTVIEEKSILKKILDKIKRIFHKNVKS